MRQRPWHSPLLQYHVKSLKPDTPVFCVVGFQTFDLVLYRNAGWQYEFGPTAHWPWRRTLSRSGGKQPDASFIPFTLPTSRSRRWPSVVDEVGYTQSNTHLRMTARWWIGNSPGDAKIVILIFINQLRTEIGFEIWEDVPPQNP